MKTQYYTATSLDGFIATEDDSLDWLFALGEPSDPTYPAFIAEVGALAMGSATYEWMLGHSEEVIKEVGSAWPYTQPTWVLANRTRPVPPGADVRFAKVDSDASPQASAAYAIRSIPTLILFDKGAEVARISGAMAAGDLVAWVRRHTPRRAGA